MEFQEAYLHWPDSPEDWKRVKKFRTRWNVPLAVSAIDGKHIAMKKPKKSGSHYYNYKGFFSLALLALVDTEYRFLWIDCGSSGSCSDRQIFNRTIRGRRSRMAALGFQHLNPWGRGDLHYLLLGDDAFALI